MEYIMNIILRDWFFDYVEEKKMKLFWWFYIFYYLVLINGEYGKFDSLDVVFLECIGSELFFY